MLIVSHREQPPVNGVSAGESGCGWCAYASSRAPARPIPRMKSTGDVPPEPPRGAVAPPAIDACGITSLIAAPAGVQQLRHVDRRRRREQPATLVRLVPHDPAADPRKPLGGSARERRERRGRGGRHVRARRRRSPTAGCPRCATTGVIPAARSASSERSVARPVVRPLLGLDLVPVEGHADGLDTHSLEIGDPLVERPRTELEPRIVGDADLDARRSLRGSRERERAREQRTRQSESPAHSRRH